jgi:mannitol/fructose-specific phosphotransferase system IIA component (Ntr-type)
MELSKVLTPELIIYPLKASSKDVVIHELVEILAKANKLGHPEAAEEAVRKREELMSTGVGRGVALPHGKYAGIEEVLVSFGISDQGVDFQAIDDQPVHIFVLLLTPEKFPSKHLKLLSKFSRMLNCVQCREELMEARSPEKIAQILYQYDQQL